ncbi:MAG: replicative DNA helicase [Oscillospiraceae bacterium]|jgi:replicative DNA helicase|nr:replicative DNA helicase [Oscillospiraceae bacterium]
MDELFELRVPHSAEAEQAVIGAMLIDPACVPDVLQRAKSEDFYLELNRDVFDTISSMYVFGKTVDPITVLDQLRIRGCLRDNSQSYLLELMQLTPTAANVMKYVEILRGQSLLRALLKVGNDITEMVRTGAGEADAMLEAAERKVYALRQGRTVGGLVTISSVIQDVYNQISVMAAEGSKMPGLPTGLPDLDSAILGLNKGDLVVIASRPGMGKTSIALNIALSVAKTSNKIVAVFSLEMSREQLAVRLLAGEGLIDGQKLLTGRLSQADWERIGTAASVISETDILIDDNPALSVADMNAQCRRLDNLGLVVIDYLQLMQSAGSGHTYAGESRTTAVSDMSRALKIMAKELNVPVVCLSQLSRANEGRTNKRPALSDLRESGAIEQDADIVIGLYREGYYDKECPTPNDAEAIILKNRHGEPRKIPLMWLPEYTSYVSADRRHDDNEY